MTFNIHPTTGCMGGMEYQRKFNASLVCSHLWSCLSHGKSGVTLEQGFIFIFLHFIPTGNSQRKR